MDNHPIPQDVTGFQFKLIGNMTVKQFAYIGLGVILGVIFYYAPLFFLIKYPLVILFVVSGTAMAFLPIEGRPMDAMIGHFIKALIVPNQYVFQQKGVSLHLSNEKKSSPLATPLPPALSKFIPTPEKKTEIQSEQKAAHDSKQEEKEKALFVYLNQVHEEHKNSLDNKESVYIEQVSEQSHAENTYVEQPTRILTANQPTTYISPAEIAESITASSQQGPLVADHKLQDMEAAQQPEDKEAESPAPSENAEEIAQLKEELAQAQAVENDVNSSKEAAEEAHQKTVELESQLQEIMADKTRLEQELEQLKKQLAEQKKEKEVKAPSVMQPKAEAKTVKKIPQNMTRQAGLLHVPDSPNLIIGLVKDPRGNFLPNILVEVKDKDGNAVRAFKTNVLGQFASATPLQNGTYTIEFEDTTNQHSFEIIEIKAEGKVMLPIEVTSQDAREELRKSLFA